MILCLIKECCRIQQSLKLVFRAAIIFLVGISLRFKIVVFSHLLAKADSFPLLLLHLNRCIMLERIDTSSSNAPTHPGKVQIFQPQARMTNKYSWVAWGGDVEASNWLAELPKSPCCGQWYVFTLSSHSHWLLSTFTIFSETRIGCKRLWFKTIMKRVIYRGRMNCSY